MKGDFIGTKPKDLGVFESSIQTLCPKCGGKAQLDRTSKYFITTCKNCGFEMGLIRV